MSTTCASSPTTSARPATAPVRDDAGEPHRREVRPLARVCQLRRRAVAGPHGQRQDRGWVHRLGQIWVEGRSPSCHDGPAHAPRSSPCATRPRTCRSPSPARPGHRPVPRAAGRRHPRRHVRATVVLHRPRHSLTARHRIRAIGIGELLARIERLRQALGRRGAFRLPPQAAAAVHSPWHRPDQRPRVSRQP